MALKWFAVRMPEMGLDNYKRFRDSYTNSSALRQPHSDSEGNYSRNLRISLRSSRSTHGIVNSNMHFAVTQTGVRISEKETCERLDL